MKNIAVIPIDNRPICYTLFEQISAINTNVKLHLPERKLLGGLTEPADISGILKWLKALPGVDYIIVSLDTIAYGGLVSSRRTPDSLDAIKSRLLEFKEALKSKGAKVFAFSSIMRISNNSINEEEKEYWNPYGKDIFAFSYAVHKAKVKNEPIPAQNAVPAHIMEDYLITRARNFMVNKAYLDWLSDGTLDTLVYSKDDTGKFGFNVQEAETLETEANSKKLNAIVKTGADEIPLSLFTKAIAELEHVRVRPIYTFDNSKSEISRYEDIPVENCVKSQLSLAGVEFDRSENAEILMLVNNFQKKQGDLVLGDTVNELEGDFQFPKTPYFIADINNANGADNELARQFTNEKFKIGTMLGYSAYNTSANTIGSALCIAVNAYLALKRGTFNEGAFKELMATRLLDDWAYQSNIRKAVREAGFGFEDALKAHEHEFQPFIEKISKFLDFNFEAEFSLPWKRSFEIEIKIKKS